MTAASVQEKQRVKQKKVCNQVNRYMRKGLKHKVQAKQIKLPLFLVSVHCIMVVFEMVRETAKKEKKDQKKKQSTTDRKSVV